MQTKFSYVEEFLNVRECCIFCNTKLSCIFTTFFGTKSALPLIKSRHKDNKFIFDLKYTSAFVNVDTKITIDTVTNNVITTDIYGVDVERSLVTLESIAPHVELQCPNKKCKMNYYLCSSSIKFLNDKGVYKMCYFSLAYECFNVSKFLIRNDYGNKSTDIFSSIGDFNHKPIMLPMIDFKAIDSDKLINKLLTMVIFS